MRAQPEHLGLHRQDQADDVGLAGPEPHPGPVRPIADLLRDQPHPLLRRLPDVGRVVERPRHRGDPEPGHVGDRLQRRPPSRARPDRLLIVPHGPIHIGYPRRHLAESRYRLRGGVQAETLQLSRSALDRNPHRSASPGTACSRLSRCECKSHAASWLPIRVREPHFRHCLRRRGPLAFSCNDVDLGRFDNEARFAGRGARGIVRVAASSPTPPTSRSPTGGPRAARRRRSPSSPRPSTPPATSGSTAPSPARGITARPIMISRITGGDPMARHPVQPRPPGRGAGRGRADARPDRSRRPPRAGPTSSPRPALLESCTLDGKIYCVPVNIHSWQWLWLSNKAFEDAGVPVPTNWDEFVAAAPKLREAGKIPLAVGGQPWQQHGAFNVLMNALGGKDLTLKVYEREGRRGRRRPRGREDLRGRRRGPRDVAGLERAGLEPGDQPRHHRRRPAARSWATGRRASSRSRARSPAPTTPACRASASTRSSRPTATPSTSRCSTTRRSRRRRRCSPRRCSTRRRRSPSTSRRARCRSARTSTSTPPTTA